ncbi:MAG: hypothetical protein HY447_02365 [Candidatus Omnitrophica bacterium]|nr:hypothetical protein [Candidatus Omnitrophota bacterium]
MKRNEIDRYFREFSKEINFPVRVILTGAAAGSLMGGVRPSMDIDFAIKMRSRRWDEIAEAVKRASRKTGIAANFAEDIDRWSSISYLDYRRHTRSYQRFGKVTVCILEPEYWAIGKLARFLETDVSDLVQVFKRQKPSPLKMARILGQALAKSPSSTASFQFRSQVEYFFKTQAKNIWGGSFNLNHFTKTFHRYAGIVG